jgi:Bacterial PH domain
MDTIIYSSNSSLDRKSKTKMLFVGLIMISVSIPGIYLSIKGNNTLVPISCGILGLYLFLLVIGLFNKPIAYNLSNSVFYIKRQAGLIRIKLSDIISIREFTEVDKKGLYRKFGAEGLFGNFGIYSSKLHRTFTVYTSRDSNWVLIETRFGKKIVISPDDLKLIDKTRELIIKNYSA